MSSPSRRKDRLPFDIVFVRVMIKSIPLSVPLSETRVDWGKNKFSGLKSVASSSTEQLFG
jgi:hypothetical protein